MRLLRGWKRENKRDCAEWKRMEIIRFGMLTPRGVNPRLDAHKKELRMNDRNIADSEEHSKSISVSFHSCVPQDPAFQLYFFSKAGKISCRSLLCIFPSQNRRMEERIVGIFIILASGPVLVKTETDKILADFTRTIYLSRGTREKRNDANNIHSICKYFFNSYLQRQSSNRLLQQSIYQIWKRKQDRP